jgi:hypothetical protein
MKNKNYVIIGVIFISIVMVSNSTAVAYIQEENIKKQSKIIEKKNCLLSSMLSSVGNKYSFDEKEFERQILKIKNIIEDGSFDKILLKYNSLAVKWLENKIRKDNLFDDFSKVNSLFSLKQNNFYKPNETRNKTNITVNICSLSGTKKVSKEISSEKYAELLLSLNCMQESLKIIHSTKSSDSEKEEANLDIVKTYNDLKIMGLIPDYLSQNEAVDLITGRYGERIFSSLKNIGQIKSLPNINKSSLKGSDVDNKFCTLSCSGEAYITYLSDYIAFLTASLPRFILVSPILLPVAAMLLILTFIEIIGIMLGLVIAIPYMLVLAWFMWKGIQGYIIVVIGYILNGEPIDFTFSEYMSIYWEWLEEKGFGRGIKLLMELIELYNVFIYGLIDVIDGLGGWASKPGESLVRLRHLLRAKRGIIGFADISGENISVSTVGLNGSKNAYVTNLKINGFFGIWIESDIGYCGPNEFVPKSTLNCAGFALKVS